MPPSPQTAQKTGCYQKIMQVSQAMFEIELDRMVTEKVNELLNTMLDVQADELTGASRYGRSDARKAYRVGRCERGPDVKAGRLSVRLPRTKR